YVQSERRDLYREALGRLRAQGLVYPCACSRRDVEAAQSAPHAGEQLFYPGTCRGRFGDWAEALASSGRTPCWRVLTPDGAVVSFVDAFAGPCSQDVAATLGDFPLARDEGGAGYTLAAAVDDLAMGVTEVVRGDDLLAATPAQILLARALAPSAPPIRYLHVPLVVGPDGRRLAKRHGDTRIAAYRAGGAAPEEVIGFLAESCGWCAKGEGVSLAALLPRFDLASIPRAPFVVAGPVLLGSSAPQFPATSGFRA
ncbi:MAG: tRNA glutamyl-Q(34) synthetase GluQRS, partial [Kiritimatiellae bacterium]|nr:tRNA glutamyl-Q(34) synthetase GluQRS [Kiritimatiellia bacterium]